MHNLVSLMAVILLVVALYLAIENHREKKSVWLDILLIVLAIAILVVNLLNNLL